MAGSYEVITERIISRLEAGTIPWRRPWSIETAEPLSLATGKPYRGINWLLLSSSGFPNPYWLTYREAMGRGGSVRRGEKGTPVVFWKVSNQEDADTGETQARFILKHYTVFNAGQTDGIATPAWSRPTNWNPIAEAERLWTDWGAKPRLEHCGFQAAYAPSIDTIVLPDRSRFPGAAPYYATLFHEAVHATGHSSRLDCGLDTTLAPFGSPDYSREELVAEMGSALLSGTIGIDSMTLDNSATYLANWIRVLRSDTRLAVIAATHAQKAADLIRGIAPSSGSGAVD